MEETIVVLVFYCVLLAMLPLVSQQVLRQDEFCLGSAKAQTPPLLSAFNLVPVLLVTPIVLRVDTNFVRRLYLY